MAEVLEGTHRVQVLLHLLRGGPKTKLELILELKINSTVLTKNVLPSLIEKGLIMLTIERRGKRKSIAHVVTLTTFGKRAAEKLVEIEKEVTEAARHRPNPLNE